MLNVKNILMKKKLTATYDKNAMEQSSNKSKFARKYAKHK